MPEGHIIHQQARQITRAFRGQSLKVDSPQGRFAEGASRVNGSAFVRALAQGKHLFIGFENDQWIHIHLGLFGKWRIGTGPAPVESGQIRLRMVGGEAYAELRGPTVCEVLTATEMESVIARIGPDPIDRAADPERAWARVHRSSVTIAALLMDQRVFAGVGNIYRAEVLFRHGLSPFRRGLELTRAEFDAIWLDLVELMAEGAKDGRIDTVRAEHLPVAMGREPRVDRHGGEVYVYRRADLPCLVCGMQILRADLQGRNLYWCSQCQG